MIKKQAKTFIVIGGLTVIIDFLAYRGILYSDITCINYAKTIGFLTGTVFAYFANKHWTFSDKSHIRHSIWRFVTLYMVTLGVNVSANAIILQHLINIPFKIHIAFCIATGISALLNFLGMKFFVFCSRK